MLPATEVDPINYAPQTRTAPNSPSGYIDTDDPRGGKDNRKRNCHWMNTSTGTSTINDIISVTVPTISDTQKRNTHTGTINDADTQTIHPIGASTQTPRMAPPAKSNFQTSYIQSSNTTMLFGSDQHLSISLVISAITPTRAPNKSCRSITGANSAIHSTDSVPETYG